MNLEFLLNDFRVKVAEMEQAALEHSPYPDGTIPSALYLCAKDVQRVAKWIARLSKRCPTLTAHCPD